MNEEIMLTITKDDAERLLVWAETSNPGAWVEHSKTVARAAETIANKCNLDTQRAYVSGLLHDIGRYEGYSELHHIYAGYKLLRDKGHRKIAEICLSHSFPYQNIGEYFGTNDCTNEETSIITSFLSNKIFDDYDKLVQLCDAIGSSVGVCLIEVRIMDVIRRHGVTDLTPQKIEALFGVKAYFDSICKMNIYDLFYDEIRSVSFK